jgi:MFS family permease
MSSSARSGTPSSSPTPHGGPPAPNAAEEADANDSITAGPAERLAPAEVRVSMGRVIVAWGFGAAFLNLSTGAIYTAFARGIGASNTAFGILAGALPLMSFLQVLSAWMLERHRRRKKQFLIAGLVGRSLWLLVPLLPLAHKYFPDLVPRAVVLPGVIFVIVASAVCQAFVSPAFFSWMTDLAPSRVRSAFFARRMQIGTLVATAVSVGGSLLADRWEEAALRANSSMSTALGSLLSDTSGRLEVYCAVLLLAAVAGILDIVMFFGVREPRGFAQPREVDEALDELAAQALPSPLAALREPLGDPAVRRFLAFVCLLFCGYGLYGPFLWLHSLEYLHLTKTETSLIVNAAPMLAMAATSRFWGGLTQRFGNRPVMRMSALGLTLIPLGMLLAQPDPPLLSKILLAALFFFSGILAVAAELANVNSLTGLAPQIPRSTMTALYSIAAGCSFALCSVAAGRLADALSDWRAQIGPLHFENFHILFVLSLLVRLTNAFVVAPRLQEPAASSARAMASEVVPQIWTNFLGRLPRGAGRDTR